MLYWCGFSIIWKLDVALLIGFSINCFYQYKRFSIGDLALYWFIAYMGSLSVISYLGTFDGIGILQFPLDILCILPYSILLLYLSQVLLNESTSRNEVFYTEEFPV